MLIQSDGGLREGDCAGAAWIIGLWGEDGHGLRYEPLAAHGRFLEPSCLVFLAEAIALDEASAELQRLFRHSVPDGPHA